MKNEITIYELFGLIKDDKAPKQIKYDNVIYIFDVCNYVSSEEECLFTEMLMNASDIEFLNEKVEVLVEKIKWEDIEECHSGEGLAFNETALEYKINQLIKNQKYLKERLDKNE